MFGCENPGQHGIVGALDTRHVDEAGGAADERAAWKSEFWHRLPAALGNDAGAVANAFPVSERFLNQPMSLEPLKFLERRKIRIAVVQMHDKSHCHEIVAEMVDERAASGAVIERPAERVLHEARPVFVGRDLPELFEPDAEFLRLTVLAQAETLDQHLGQAAARTFGK